MYMNTIIEKLYMCLKYKINKNNMQSAECKRPDVLYSK